MSAATVTVTLGAFTVPLEIDGQTVNVPVPAGVTATFVMPAVSVSFTSDSSVTSDSGSTT